MMSEIQVDESSAPDVEHNDAIETQPSIDHASLHAEAKTESNRCWVDVAAAWLALLLVVVGVVCALVLLGVALVFGVGSQLGGHQHMIRCYDQTRTAAKSIIRDIALHVVGTAPIWMRDTLLTAVAAKALAKIFGFDGSRQRSSTASRSQENLRASGTDGLLTSL
eukprot:SAG11_NODE_14010_length_628_cov_13.381853_1_plen_164_part_10